MNECVCWGGGGGEGEGRGGEGSPLADLHSSMGTKVEVELVRVSDADIHCGACRDVPTPPDLGKQSYT